MYDMPDKQFESTLLFETIPHDYCFRAVRGAHFCRKGRDNCHCGWTERYPFAARAHRMPYAIRTRAARAGGRGVDYNDICHTQLHDTHTHTHTVSRNSSSSYIMHAHQSKAKQYTTTCVPHPRFTWNPSQYRQNEWLQMDLKVVTNVAGAWHEACFTLAASSTAKINDTHAQKCNGCILVCTFAVFKWFCLKEENASGVLRAASILCSRGLYFVRYARRSPSF